MHFRSHMRRSLHVTELSSGLKEHTFSFTVMLAATFGHTPHEAVSLQSQLLQEYTQTKYLYAYFSNLTTDSGVVSRWVSHISALI